MNVAKPKYFADVNLGKPPEYYEYDNLKITFGYMTNTYSEIQKNMK